MKHMSLRILLKKIYKKVVTGPREEKMYQKWVKAHTPDEAEWERQSKEKFPYMPLYSIVVPLFRTPENFLEELIVSVQAQSYARWELILSDGSGEPSLLQNYLDKYAEDKRIKVLKSVNPLDISENTNCGLEKAEGDYIVFADHDDVFSTNALYECTKAICEHDTPDLIYSDEDKITMDGNRYFQPHFKPDFNLDLLRSMNYFCHLVVVKKGLQEKVGLLKPEYNGAQDYDFVLRCVERAENICHIPKVLYHWRAHKGSIAGNGKSKEYAFEAGRQALLAHYERCGIDAVVEKAELFGVFHTIYKWKYKPLISVISTEETIQGILKETDYRPYEIVGNVKEAKGEFLLFIHPCVRIADTKWLDEMAAFAMRSEVAVVGAHLFYAAGKQYHGGTVLGYENVLTNVAMDSEKEDVGYFGRYICAQEYSAVAGACMMVRKTCFDEVGGFDEKLNDPLRSADFCLKVRKKGYLVVYNPRAKMYVQETLKRKNIPEVEKKIFRQKWESFLKKGDPFYNPNLSLKGKLFVLKSEDKDIN